MILYIITDCACLDRWNVNCLVCIADLFMCCHSDFLIGQCLISNNGFRCNCCCIKGKGYVYTSFCLSWGEGCACSYFLSANQNRFSGCFIHKLTGYDITAVWKQICIKYGINYCCGLCRLCMVNSCDLILCGCMDLWNVNHLIIVLEIFMLR